VLVSVFIPTLDRPKLLLRTIDNAVRQTHREIEVIVWPIGRTRKRHQRFRRWVIPASSWS
jgi:hypothetical protein